MLSSNTVVQLTILSLPAEILQQVFLTLIQSIVNQHLLVEFGSDQLGTRQSLASLARSQQVLCSTCSSWRALAISYAPLWARIPLHSKQWALKCFDRSKSTPLALFGAGRLDEFTDVFFSEPLADRVELIALLADSQWLKNWIPRLPSQYPALEALYLGIPHKRNSPQFIKISTLFSLPNLRRLRVSLHLIDWEMTSPFRATQLTSLSFDRTRPAFTSELLSVLQRTPTLESLDITEREDRNLTPVDLPQSAIHLPRLALLQMRGHLHRCSDILSRLQYPPLTVLRITINGWGRYPSPEGTRLGEFFALCGLGDGSLARRMDARFETTSKAVMTLAIWDTTFKSSPDTARVSVSFSDKWSQNCLARLILHHLSVPSIEQLFWTSEDEDAVPSNMMAVVIRGMPKLKEFALKCPIIRPYAWVFEQLNDPEDGEPTRLSYFPSLVRLELSGVDFTRRVNDRPEVEELKAVLAHRKKYQGAIVSLHLKDCVHIGQEVVDVLERAQVVQEVIWDGVSH